MKIVCDNCAAKYSIADEKVRGKIFKIKCKKCNQVIVVRGNQGGEAVASTSTEEPAAVAAPAASDAVWHLVLGGDQAGPFSPADVRAKFSARQIDAESYLWREGFSDWQRLAEVAEFADLLSALEPVRQNFEAASEGVGREDGLTRRSPMDLFSSSDSGVTQRAVAAEVYPSQPGGNGAGAAANFGSALESAAEAQATATSAARMTGQRNENSVLFSLNNLQGMATSQPDPSRPGHASMSSEGSGLIDIRAMAAKTLSSAPTPFLTDSADLPMFSTAPVFSPVVAAPLLMPTPSRGMPMWGWVAIAGGALLAVIGVSAALLGGRSTSPAPAPVSPTAAAVLAHEKTPEKVLEKGIEKTPATAPAKAGANTEAKPETVVEREDRHGSHRSRHDHHHGKADKEVAQEVTREAAPAPVPVVERPAAPAKKRGGDSLDDLLDNATAGSSRRAAAAAASTPREPAEDPNLPDQLQRGDIVSGMNGVKGRVDGCAAQFHVPGTAMVSVVIAKTGRVQSASVGGALAGTPTGDCVARSVKAASFKRFKGSPMSINYPFILRP